MMLVCHVIFYNYLIKLTCGFMDRSLSLEITIMLSLLAIDTLKMKWRYSDCIFPRDLARQT